MRHHEHFGARRQGLAQRRQRRTDAGIAGDHAVGHRNIQILTDQYPLAREGKVCHAPNFHQTAWDQAIVVSSMRLEKPHSLSYQAHTFTSVPPTTLVSVASNVEECASWLKS